MAGAADSRRPLVIALPLHLAEPEADDVRPTAALGHCLVTGAAGFLGRHLVLELLRRGARVRGLDVAPLELHHPHFERVPGDVRAWEDVRKACEGIDTVFHTAAVVDRARLPTRTQRERSYAVNVRGTEHVVRAAREAGAARLVHTSASEVTWDGPVRGGDGARPHAARTRDLYTETKRLGEEIALAANGHGGLLTCALRPGAIYGPGESRVLPRLLERLARGRSVARLGGGSALTDHVFIDDLVEAEVEAARHLLLGSALCGEAYFVSDGAPADACERFRPLIEALGFHHAARSVAAAPVRRAPWLWEALQRAGAGLGVARRPLCARDAERLSVSHGNRIGKAERDIGWRPRVAPEEGLARMIEPCRRLLAEREAAARARGPSLPNVRWLLALVTNLHRALYQGTGGRLGASAGALRFLLLGCMGRRSGRERVVPLLTVEDGGRFVVVASNAGDARDPAWWKNLRARPDAWIRVGPRRLAVRAREASPGEAERLWPRLLAAYPGYEAYRARAGRPIPLVVLEPAR